MNSLALLFAALVPTQTSDIDRLHNAEMAYLQGLEARNHASKAMRFFQEAAQGYELLWQAGYTNPALGDNLAKAYFLSGRLADAIRVYRQALQRFPSDRQLQMGLQEVCKRVRYPLVGNIEELARPKEESPIVHLFSFQTWLAIVIGIYSLIWFLLVRSWMRRSIPGLVASVISLFLVIGLCSFLFLAQEDLQMQQPQVVLAQETNLRTGNSRIYPTRLDGILPAGVEASVLCERGGWLQIQLASQVIGWIPASHVVWITPLNPS